MPIGYVLRQAGHKMGLDPSDEAQREVLLRFVNEAANELYDQSDMGMSLMEDVFLVHGDQTIALPSYVGPLRAMREYSTHVTWKLNDMRPRYSDSNWPDRWRNWRLKGVAGIHTALINEAPLGVMVHEVETPNVVVTISGSTTTAQFVSESITVDNIVKVGTLNFVGNVRFKKNRVNNHNLTLHDADGTEISMLPNNMLEARYRIVDVSLYPWTSTTSGPTSHYMEVLYKEALPWFENDDDEYPVSGYDNIIVNKVLQLWHEEQGKPDLAVAFDSKATRSLARKNEDANRGAQQTASLVENSHDTLLPRNRQLGPSRYMGQVYY